MPDDDPIVAPDGNLIVNGNFMAKDPQQRPLRWVAGPGLQTATISHEQHHSGNKDDCALKVVDASLTDSALVRSEKRIRQSGHDLCGQGVGKGWQRHARKSLSGILGSERGPDRRHLDHAFVQRLMAGDRSDIDRTRQGHPRLCGDQFTRGREGRLVLGRCVVDPPDCLRSHARHRATRAVYR